MTATKGAIIRTIELMDDSSADFVFDWLSKHFSVPQSEQEAWDSIEEVEPDEIDLEMLREIDANPDCKIFISEKELFARREA
jgi:hypothetical protein